MRIAAGTHVIMGVRPQHGDAALVKPRETGGMRAWRAVLERVDGTPLTTPTHIAGANEHNVAWLDPYPAGLFRGFQICRQDRLAEFEPVFACGMGDVEQD